MRYSLCCGVRDICGRFLPTGILVSSGNILVSESRITRKFIAIITANCLQFRVNHAYNSNSYHLLCVYDFSDFYHPWCRLNLNTHVHNYVDDQKHQTHENNICTYSQCENLHTQTNNTSRRTSEAHLSQSMDDIKGLPYTVSQHEFGKVGVCRVGFQL